MSKGLKVLSNSNSVEGSLRFAVPDSRLAHNVLAHWGKSEEPRRHLYLSKPQLSRYFDRMARKLVI